MPKLINGETFYMTTEACTLAGTNKNTFLRWVRNGVFTDVQHRDRNGWRLFTEDDIHRLRDRLDKVHKIVKNRNPFTTSNAKAKLTIANIGAVSKL